MTENEIENMRLRLMAEVNERFDEIVRDLNDNGTEFARSLEKEIVVMRNSVKKEVENVWSYLKSKLVSIETGQKMLYDPKDGIMTKILGKVDMAVKMARDSAACTAACTETLKESKRLINDKDDQHEREVETYKNFVRDSRLYMLIFIVTIAAATLGGLGLGVAKIIQDHNNQVQTVSYLDSLNKGVKVDGLVEVVNGLPPGERKALLSKLNKK